MRFYQRAVSPALPPRCRFHPTCSAYAVEAIERHGAARGSWLAVRRLAKCAPWHPGGVDLVPPAPPSAVPPPADPSPGERAGTAHAARSSSTPAPTSGPDSPPTATPQARRRATQEESSVA
ncbi:membrane protein insertion efficiency factor YidD [Geodermatophilus sp. YIM 151500]|uniref:membrane protein insertion efficiency factor YidD n=1 Tax=Geodermatophilus sp. YIM 151500 TaxID=2984531 RepID=UPI0021E40F93|nr:membrane protein insertion efficiency factor YidD [Geodermatophilus sp. YIM 151500]